MILQNKLVKDSNTKFISTIERIESLQQTQRETFCEMKVKIKALENSENEIRLMESKMDKLKNDEEDLIKKNGDERTIQIRIGEISKNSNRLTNIINDIDRTRVNFLNNLRRVELDMENNQRSLADIENLKAKRMEILRRRDKDVFEAVIWLRKNKDMFKNNVYEPMIMEVSFYVHLFIYSH